MIKSADQSSKLQFHPRKNIDQSRRSRPSNYTIKLLFLTPPTLQYNDFVHPPDNVGTIRKGSKDFGMVLTDLPLGIVSLSAYLKKHIALFIIQTIIICPRRKYLFLNPCYLIILIH